MESRSAQQSLRFSRKLRRLSTALFDAQMWAFGCDISNPDGNLLIRRGFTRSRPCADRCGSSCYRLETKDYFSITLWGFGILIKNQDLGSLFIRRHGFDPRFSIEQIECENCFRPSELPYMKQPRGRDCVFAMKLLRRLSEALIDYESWVLQSKTEGYRRSVLYRGKKSVRKFAKRPLDREWGILESAILELY